MAAPHWPCSNGFAEGQACDAVATSLRFSQWQRVLRQAQDERVGSPHPRIKYGPGSSPLPMMETFA